MSRHPNETVVAIIGPLSSWETTEAIDNTVEGLELQAIRTMVLDARRHDPKFTTLRDKLRSNQVGGLVVANYSYRYHDELDLSPDPKVIEVAKQVVEAVLPVFVNVEPTMGGLDFDNSPELIVIGNNMEIIRNRLEERVGAA